MERLVSTGSALAMTTLLFCLTIFMMIEKDHGRTFVKHYPHVAFVGGVLWTCIMLALATVTLWFACELPQNDRFSHIFFMPQVLSLAPPGADLAWQGGQFLGIWESVLAGKIVLIVLTPAVAVSLALGIRTLCHYLDQISRGNYSPAWAAVFTGFLTSSGLWLAGHVFFGRERIAPILPPPLLLAAYLLIGMILLVKFEPEITGNIVVDAGLAALFYLSAGLLFSSGFWIWVVTLPETDPKRVQAWAITWLALGFLIRCLLGNPHDKKRSTVCTSPFGRIWAAMPIAMLGLLIIAALTGIIRWALTLTEAETKSSPVPWAAPVTEPVTKTSQLPAVPPVVIFGLWSLTVIVVLMPPTVWHFRLARGGVIASIARGFGYGTTCLCIVSAVFGAWRGDVIIPPSWALIIGLLFCGIVLYNQVEITGNSPLDAFLLSALIILLAQILANGVWCAVQLKLFSEGIFWIWLLGSLVIGLAIRVFHWATD